MRRSETRERPADQNGAPQKQSGLATTSPSILADVDALAEQLRARLVVQVAIDDTRYRTTIYRSAVAAERAVQRAKDRGKVAHVSLCQLLPVGVVASLGGGRDE